MENKNNGVPDFPVSEIDVDFLLEENSKCDYMLVPCGFFYNRRLSTCAKGDVMTDIRGIKARICDIVRLSTTSRATDMLCRVRYGVPIVRRVAEWRRDAVLFGHNRTAVSEKECLFITYEIIKDNRGRKK